MALDLRAQYVDVGPRVLQQAFADVLKFELKFIQLNLGTIMEADNRLPPDEFKAEFKRRGWTGRALAKRWGKSETWVSKIASDPDRGPHWDDAVRGLPFVGSLKQSSK